MTELLFAGALVLPTLVCVLLSIAHERERKAWGIERRDLLDRVMAHSFESYKVFTGSESAREPIPQPDQGDEEATRATSGLI